MSEPVRPTAGRIVWYYPEGRLLDPRQDEKRPSYQLPCEAWEPLAAIVLGADGMSADLDVRGSREFAPFVAFGVPYSATFTTRTPRWTYPPGAPPQRAVEAPREPSKPDYNGLLCRVCRSPQFVTPSGVTCENGHGGAPGERHACDTPKEGR